MKCPRTIEGPFVYNDNVEHTGKDICTYCGSLLPELFMEGLEKGEIRLGPTDKNYKVYIKGVNLASIKFYFQHLSEDQKKRFVELLNTEKLEIEFPGYFYVLPYFTCKK